MLIVSNDQSIEYAIVIKYSSRNHGMSFIQDLVYLTPERHHKQGEVKHGGDKIKKERPLLSRASRYHRAIIVVATTGYDVTAL